MFTGLVEHIGTVSHINQVDQAYDGGQGWSITVYQAKEILDDCKLGDSIAINGTCLTVTSFDSDSFKVNLAPETLRRTNLGGLEIGSKVNLERASLGMTRFGGHFVQGHVDATATIISITPEENSIWYKLQIDREYLKHIVPKGYVTLDGTSLTVCEVDDSQSIFTIMMIPYTQEHVIMPTKKVGDLVNVEVDMLGKYVEKIVANALGSDPSDTNSYLYKMVQNAVERQLKDRESK